MKKYYLIALLLISNIACSDDHKVIFSSYSSDLKVASYNEKEDTTKFEGNITIKGTLFFIFDQDAPGHANDINFAHFVPDAASKKLLPEAIAGYYPGPINYISLEPADAALEATFGKEKALKYKHGNRPTISAATEVQLKQFSVDINCDSRTYGSTNFSIKLLPEQHAYANEQAAHGC